MKHVKKFNLNEDFINEEFVNEKEIDKYENLNEYLISNLGYIAKKHTLAIVKAVKKDLRHLKISI